MGLVLRLIMVVCWCSMMMSSSTLVIAALRVHVAVVTLKAWVWLWLWYPGQCISCVLALCDVYQQSAQLCQKGLTTAVVKCQVNQMIICRRYPNGQACNMVLRQLMLIIVWLASGTHADIWMFVCPPKNLNAISGLLRGSNSIFLQRSLNRFTSEFKEL